MDGIVEAFDVGVVLFRVGPRSVFPGSCHLHGEDDCVEIPTYENFVEDIVDKLSGGTSVEIEGSVPTQEPSLSPKEHKASCSRKSSVRTRFSRKALRYS